MRRQPWAVFDKDGNVVYLGLHRDKKECLDIFLGYPSNAEVRDYKADGYRAQRVMITMPEQQS